MLNQRIMGILVFPAYDRPVFEGFLLMADSTAHLIVGVDDDFRVRECLASLLESAGLFFVVFASAEEFLRSGKLAAAGCLITDVRMPGMNGIELQHQVRSERPELPCIFVSGHFNEETREMAVAGGAFALMDKPFDPEALLQTLHQAMQDSALD